MHQTSIEKLLAKQYMTHEQFYRILKREHDYSLSHSSSKRYVNLIVA